MHYYTYIIHSDSLHKYYVGNTQNLKIRLNRHNTGQEKFTKPGVPWKLIKSFIFKDRTNDIRLEYKIKKRGIKRFLENI